MYTLGGRGGLILETNCILEYKPPLHFRLDVVYKVGGWLIFEYAISLEYKSPQSLCERYVHFQSSCLHKNTVTKAFYRKQLKQDQEDCSWTSRLQASWSPYITIIQDNWYIITASKQVLYAHLPTLCQTASKSAATDTPARWQLSLTRRCATESITFTTTSL